MGFSLRKAIAECSAGFSVVGIKVGAGEMGCMEDKDIGVKTLICMGLLMVGSRGLP